jgi:hypothetical protein
MQQQRKTLSARLVHNEEPSPAAAAIPKIIVEAIMLKVCVAAVYNKTAIKMAPQIVYTKHDELFIDGVVIERDGKPPKEVKLGTFKLVGLSELAPTIRAFAPVSVFDAKDSKYEGTTLYVVKG